MNENDPVITHGCFHPDNIEEMKYFEECKVYTIQVESNLACPQEGCRSIRRGVYFSAP